MTDPTPLLPGRSASRAMPARRRGEGASPAHSDTPCPGLIIGSPFPYLLPPRPRPGPAAALAVPTEDGDVEAPPPPPAGLAPLTTRPSGGAASALHSPPPTPLTDDVYGTGAVAAAAAMGGTAAARAASSPRRAAPPSALANGVRYGLIQAIICLPTMISFCAIVFRDRRTYGPVLGALAKLAFLSSGVHQAVFTARSTLPFAVGQVQDIGLIVLSAMTGDVAERARAAGAPAASAVATALVALAGATLFVGVFLIALGALKAASIVQNVPLPVVGGE